MERSGEQRDKHFPVFVHDNAFRRLFCPPRRLVEPYIRTSQTAADLGCGPGFFTLALAELAGPEGKVYAVDSDVRAVHELEKKAAERGIRTIEAHARSASDLSFIRDASVDFVLCHGLLCSMVPKDHEAAVSEIKRVLKQEGMAYLSVAKGPWSYVDRAEWERILEGFAVVRRSDGCSVLSDRWAVVTPKKRRYPLRP